MSVDCDGKKASGPPGRPCPRKAKWMVDWGQGITARFCNYHRGVAVEFGPKDLKVTSLETCPAPEPTPAT